MARCGCAGNTCSCVVLGAGAIDVSGSGTPNNPYIVSGGSEMQVVDTATVNLTLTGSGSTTEPFVLSAATTLELGEISDVSVAGATTGQVLARQSGGTYAFVPPTTASPGAINVGQDLQGDGSSGNPLRAKLVSGGGLSTSASGLALAGSGAWTPYTPVWTASTTNPTLGNGSLTGRYTRFGNKTVHFSLRLTFGTTTTRGVGTSSFSLPSTPAAPSVYQAYLYGVGSGVYAGVGASGSALTARIDAVVLNTSLRGENFSHSVPTSMTATSVLWISGTYEEA